MIYLLSIVNIFFLSFIAFKISEDKRKQKNNYADKHIKILVSQIEILVDELNSFRKSVEEETIARQSLNKDKLLFSCHEHSLSTNLTNAFDKYNLTDKLFVDFRIRALNFQGPNTYNGRFIGSISMIKTSLISKAIYLGGGELDIELEIFKLGEFETKDNALERHVLVPSSFDIDDVPEDLNEIKKILKKKHSEAILKEK